MYKFTYLTPEENKRINEEVTILCRRAEVNFAKLQKTIERLRLNRNEMVREGSIIS